MSSRILKESICTSDTIDKLSWFEEVLFYRLIVNCDDYGRYDGRELIIKNKLFPLKDNLTLKTVHEAIEKLASVGLVILYTYEERPYLYLPTWNDHQNVRAKKSKYPDPSDNICIQMYSDASKCSRNPIQSNPNPNPNPNPNARDADERFSRFWDSYPRKVGKQAAAKAFDKAIRSTSLETMLTALEKQKRSSQWTRDNGQYIPNPSTWLNQGRWDDELEENNAGTDSGGHKQDTGKRWNIHYDTD